MPKGIKGFQKGQKFTAEHRRKLSEIRIGKKLSKETREKMSIQRKDDNHNLWKGDDASYIAKHQWISRKLGKPDTCEICDKTGLKGHKIHWANISGNYTRDILDWIRLCVRCHIEFDKRNDSAQAKKAWVTKKHGV